MRLTSAQLAMDTSVVLPSPVNSVASDSTLDSGLSDAKSATLVGDDPWNPPSSPSESELEYCEEYQVYVVQYRRANSDAVDWELAVRTCITTENGRREGFGNLYRLDGRAGGYRYERKEDVNYESDDGWRCSALVSRISFAELGDVESIIQGVDIENDDPNFDARTWAFDVLRALRAHGFAVDDNIRTVDDLEKIMNDLDV